MKTQTFEIAHEAEADEHLRDLLAKPEYRSMAEVKRRAHEIVSGYNLKKYFVAKGAEILKNT